MNRKIAKLNVRVYKKNNAFKYIVIALIARLFMLTIVFLLSDYFSQGFIGSENYYDDFRYEAGGLYYMQNATSIIDIQSFADAYASVNDWVGYKLSTPFTSTPLWYWVVCIVMYIFKTKWAVRILNIFLSAFAVGYVYRFSELVYGEKTAEKASLLLALLPYPVIFSCFAYKDQLVMLLTFCLLYTAAYYKYYSYISFTEILKTLFVILCLMRHVVDSQSYYYVCVCVLPLVGKNIMG